MQGQPGFNMQMQPAYPIQMPMQQAAAPAVPGQKDNNAATGMLFFVAMCCCLMVMSGMYKLYKQSSEGNKTRDPGGKVLRKLGENCASDDQCLEGKCLGPPSGVKKCTTPLIYGERCTADYECIGQNCVNNVCGACYGTSDCFADKAQCLRAVTSGSGSGSGSGEDLGFGMCNEVNDKCELQKLAGSVATGMDMSKPLNERCKTVETFEVIRPPKGVQKCVLQKDEKTFYPQTAFVQGAKLKQTFENTTLPTCQSCGFGFSRFDENGECIDKIGCTCVELPCKDGYEKFAGTCNKINECHKNLDTTGQPMGKLDEEGFCKPLVNENPSACEYGFKDKCNVQARCSAEDWATMFEKGPKKYMKDLQFKYQDAQGNQWDWVERDNGESKCVKKDDTDYKLNNLMPPEKPDVEYIEMQHTPISEDYGGMGRQYSMEYKIKGFSEDGTIKNYNDFEANGIDTIPDKEFGKFKIDQSLMDNEYTKCGLCAGLDTQAKCEGTDADLPEVMKKVISDGICQWGETSQCVAGSGTGSNCESIKNENDCENAECEWKTQNSCLDNMKLEVKARPRMNGYRHNFSSFVTTTFDLCKYKPSVRLFNLPNAYFTHPSIANGSGSGADNSIGPQPEMRDDLTIQNLVSGSNVTIELVDGALGKGYVYAKVGVIVDFNLNELKNNNGMGIDLEGVLITERVNRYIDNGFTVDYQVEGGPFDGSWRKIFTIKLEPLDLGNEYQFKFYYTLRQEKPALIENGETDRILLGDGHVPETEKARWILVDELCSKINHDSNKQIKITREGESGEAPLIYQDTLRLSETNFYPSDASELTTDKYPFSETMRVNNKQHCLDKCALSGCSLVGYDNKTCNLYWESQHTSNIKFGWIQLGDKHHTFKENHPPNPDWDKTGNVNTFKIKFLCKKNENFVEYAVSTIKLYSSTDMYNFCMSEGGRLATEQEYKDHYTTPDAGKDSWSPFVILLSDLNRTNYSPFNSHCSNSNNAFSTATKTLDECAALCDENAECKGFAHNGNMGCLTYTDCAKKQGGSFGTQYYQKIPASTEFMKSNTPGLYKQNSIDTNGTVVKASTSIDVTLNDAHYYFLKEDMVNSAKNEMVYRLSNGNYKIKLSSEIGSELDEASTPAAVFTIQYSTDRVDCFHIKFGNNFIYMLNNGRLTKDTGSGTSLFKVVKEYFGDNDYMGRMENGEVRCLVKAVFDTEADKFLRQTGATGSQKITGVDTIDQYCVITFVPADDEKRKYRKFNNDIGSNNGLSNLSTYVKRGVVDLHLTENAALRNDIFYKIKGYMTNHSNNASFLYTYSIGIENFLEVTQFEIGDKMVVTMNFDPYSPKPATVQFYVGWYKLTTKKSDGTTDVPGSITYDLITVGNQDVITGTYEIDDAFLKTVQLNNNKYFSLKFTGEVLQCTNLTVNRIPKNGQTPESTQLIKDLETWEHGKNKYNIYTQNGNIMSFTSGNIRLRTILTNSSQQTLEYIHTRPRYYTQMQSGKKYFFEQYFKYSNIEDYSSDVVRVEFSTQHWNPSELTITDLELQEVFLGENSGAEYENGLLMGDKIHPFNFYENMAPTGGVNATASSVLECMKSCTNHASGSGDGSECTMFAFNKTDNECKLFTNAKSIDEDDLEFENSVDTIVGVKEGVDKYVYQSLVVLPGTYTLNDKTVFIKGYHDGSFSISKGLGVYMYFSPEPTHNGSYLRAEYNGNRGKDDIYLFKATLLGENKAYIHADTFKGRFYLLDTNMFTQDDPDPANDAEYSHTLISNELNPTDRINTTILCDNDSQSMQQDFTIDYSYQDNDVKGRIDDCTIKLDAEGTTITEFCVEKTKAYTNESGMGVIRHKDVFDNVNTRYNAGGIQYANNLCNKEGKSCINLSKNMLEASQDSIIHTAHLENNIYKNQYKETPTIFTEQEHQNNALNIYDWDKGELLKRSCYDLHKNRDQTTPILTHYEASNTDVSIDLREWDNNIMNGCAASEFSENFNESLRLCHNSFTSVKTGDHNWKWIKNTGGAVECIEQYRTCRDGAKKPTNKSLDTWVCKADGEGVDGGELKDAEYPSISDASMKIQKGNGSSFNGKWKHDGDIAVKKVQCALGFTAIRSGGDEAYCADYSEGNGLFDVRKKTNPKKISDTDYLNMSETTETTAKYACFDDENCLGVQLINDTYYKIDANHYEKFKNFAPETDNTVKEKYKYWLIGTRTKDKTIGQVDSNPELVNDWSCSRNDHNECTSNYCNKSNKCDVKKNHNNVCVEDEQCTGRGCLKKKGGTVKKCIRNDGTRDYDYPCTNDNQCNSKACATNTGSDKDKICTPPKRPIGFSCSADNQCVSNHCNLNTNKCNPLLANGKTCRSHNICVTGFCENGKCRNKYPLHSRCQYNVQCNNGRCTSNGVRSYCMNEAIRRSNSCVGNNHHTCWQKIRFPSDRYHSATFSLNRAGYKRTFKPIKHCKAHQASDHYAACHDNICVGCTWESNPWYKKDGYRMQRSYLSW